MNKHEPFDSQTIGGKQNAEAREDDALEYRRATEAPAFTLYQLAHETTEADRYDILDGEDI